MDTHSTRVYNIIALTNKAIKTGGILFGAFLMIGWNSFLHAEWVDKPENGWVMEYDASSGLRPGEGDTWENAAYKSAEKENCSWTYIKPEDGKCVLYMANRGCNVGEDKMSEYAHYKTPVSERSRTVKSGFLTIDFAFRVIHQKENTKASFGIWASFPHLAEESENLICSLKFTEAEIKYVGNKMSGAQPPSFLVWHKARLHIDVRNKKYTLYLDGAEMPVHEGMLYKTPEKGFKIGFGDGSSEIHGDVELRYFRWTDAELVPVSGR